MFKKPYKSLYPKITFEEKLCNQGRLVKIIDDGPWWDGGIYWFHEDDNSPCGGDECSWEVK